MAEAMMGAFRWVWVGCFRAGRGPGGAAEMPRKGVEGLETRVKKVPRRGGKQVFWGFGKIFPHKRSEIWYNMR